MRKIKFRIWDRSGEQWVEWASFVHNSCISINEAFDQENFIFQQFTGLIDKNGKKIYEGDILDVKGDRGYVEYLSESACYTLRHPIFRAFRLDLYIIDYHCGGDRNYKASSHNMEIVGNIFETPYLLKETHG